MARKSAKRAADKSEMIRWLFDNSRDPMHVADPAGAFMLVNPAWCEITGLAEDELIGRKVLDFAHADDRDGVREMAPRLRPDEALEQEVRIIRADGAYQWFASRTQRMADGAFLVALRDATAARADRQEVEDARRTRKMLGASAGIGMWVYEPKKRAIEWSDEFAALVGFEAGRPGAAPGFWEILHPDERKRVRQILMNAVRTGKPAKLEHRVWSVDGWLSIRTTVHPERRPHGVTALKGLSEDITELVEARDAAREGAGRLDLALQAAEAGVYEIDHVARTVWCSPEFERITGQKNSSYEEATELRYPGFHVDDLPHVRASFRALHRGDKKSGESFEARIVRPDGSERWVRVFHHLLVNRNGRWLKAVGLIQDCDALKRQELALIEAQRAAEAGAEAKSAFLANMSHEIRTPLNGVMGVLHLLNKEGLSAEGRELLSEALSCGRMLSELLNDVIDFSKIEAGRLELASEPVDPCALVRSVARLLEPQARAKGLQLLVETDCAMGWVLSDPVRLRQALFNLVGNAVKFTETGHVMVRCRRGDAGALRFEVQDTGVGIPEAAQSRLFERFNQADASTTRRFGGSGLGLAITRRLAEIMGGQVGFASKAGEGSTFWFEIAAEQSEARGQADDAGLAALEGVRVLVVEDNATNRLIVTKLLEGLGASVETACDGRAGVKAAAHGGFDVILMDIQMPGLDGLEAARRIRALGGAPAATPIVALTANVLAHQRQAYLDAGMDGVVGKPIAPGLLLAEIGRAAAKRADVDGSAAA